MFRTRRSACYQCASIRRMTLGGVVALAAWCGGDALAQDILSVDELRSLLDSQAGEIASLRDALGSRSDALEEARAELDEASSARQVELDNANSRLAAAAQALARYQSDQASSRSALVTVTEQNESLQAELASANSRLAAAEQAFALYELEIAALKAETQAHSAANASLLQEIDQALLDSNVQGAAVSSRADGVVIALASESLFDSGKGQLNATGQALVGSVADAIAHLHNDIAVEGHTDTKGVGVNLERPFGNNWELSVVRAASAVNYMHSNTGIDPKRLSARGFGEHRPVASNETVAGRAANRRVEVIVLH